MFDSHFDSRVSLQRYQPALIAACPGRGGGWWALLRREVWLSHPLLHLAATVAARWSLHVCRHRHHWWPVHPCLSSPAFRSGCSVGGGGGAGGTGVALVGQKPSLPSLIQRWLSCILNQMRSNTRRQDEDWKIVFMQTSIQAVYRSTKIG